MSQEKAWRESEGNNWFARNKEQLGKKKDMVLSALDFYGIVPKKAVEIGCSNGYRLAALHDKHGAAVVGVEPSASAVEDGRKRWPFIRFNHDTAEISAEIDASNMGTVCLLKKQEIHSEQAG